MPTTRTTPRRGSIGHRRDDFADLERFVGGLLALRHRHPVARPAGRGGATQVQWFGTSGAADTGGASRSLAWCVGDLYVIANAYWESLTFTIQADGPWVRVVDTALASPDDIVEPADAPTVGSTYDVAARSVVILERRGRIDDQRRRSATWCAAPIHRCTSSRRPRPANAPDASSGSPPRRASTRHGSSSASRSENRTWRVAQTATHLAVHVFGRDRIDVISLFGGETGDESTSSPTVRWSEGPARCPDARWCGGLVRRADHRALRPRRPRRPPPRAGHRGHVDGRRTRR